MNCTKMLLVGLIAAASSAAADDPPPFGTVVQKWPLPASIWSNGITWRRDSERFYLVNRGNGGGTGVWSFDPIDPPGTLRRENWVIPNLGTATEDMPWSIAWDGDSACFWISDIVDASTYGSCYYVRMRQTPAGDTWRWFSENPGDTWFVGDGDGGGAGTMYWMAGSEKWLGRGYFACAPVAPTGINNYVWKFDPYTKTDLGRCASGSSTSERGCTLVPWDSNYIITTGWNANAHYLHDSNGVVLRSAAATDSYSVDIALWEPETLRPEDTVFFYCTFAYWHFVVQKISVGLLWGQLEPGQAIGEPGWPVPAANHRLRIEPNPCRGSAFLSFTGPLDHLTTGPLSLSLFDPSGRLVLHSSLASRNSSLRLDLRSLPAGVYVLRLSTGTSTSTQKVVLQR